MRLTPRWSARLSDCIAALAISADGAHAAAASLSGQVALLEVEAGRLTGLLADHAGGALAVAFSPSGALVATGGHDGMVNLVRIRDGGLVASMPTAKGAWVEHLRWNRPGDVLAAAAGRGVCCFRVDGVPLGDPVAHASTVSALAAAPRGRGFISTCYGGVSRFEPGDAEARRLEWKGSILCLAVAPDEKWLVTGSQDAAMHVWHESGQQFYMSGYPTKVTQVKFSPDGLWLASNAGHAACVWPFDRKGPAGREPVNLMGHDGAIPTMAWVPVGGRASPTLATGSADGSVRLWALRSATAIAAAQVGDPVERVAVSPDGRWLLAGTRTGGVTGYEIS